MTMSGTIGRTPATFQQQGSVDWVELSGRSIQFSVAVLARLSRAGIDPFTLQVGRAICTNFVLHPTAQARISDAIIALKKFGSYEDIIWFGFGIKHVVTDLAETEEGLTLVALCAALSATYDSLYGARVLRQLCCLCKAPQFFSPAIRQWKLLIELCAGMLSVGHFALVLDGFHRLVSGARDQSKIETNRSPTTYSALAEAILALAQVTNRTLASATFTGGLDCMWLAAVAEWIFSLDVIIFSSAGVLLYRSRSLDQQPPQITLVYLEYEGNEEKESFISEKTSLISGGCTLFVREDKNPLGDIHFFSWRSSWSTILHDTFHESVDELLKGENAYQFGVYLYCVSMIQESDLLFNGDSNSADVSAHLFSSNIVDPLLWSQESSRGHKFLTFASERLPELRHCLKDFKLKFSSIPQEKTSSHRSAAIREMERHCTDHTFQNPAYHYTAREESGVCLAKLASAILVFLWITLVSDIDPEIEPSVTGLSNLYRWLGSFHGAVNHGRFAPSISIQAQQTALIFYVLSGLFVDPDEQALTSLPSNYLAMAGAGICVYRQALADPNLPPDSIFRYRVVSGYISHAGAVFKRIRNFSGQTHPPTFSFDASSVCQSVDALVQETDRDSELAMAYQVNYIDSRGKKKYFFLALGRLLRNLQSKVVMLKCEGGCPDLPIKPQQTSDRPNMAQEVLSWRGSRRYPIVFFDQAANVNAQRLVANLRGSSNLWVLTSINKIQYPKEAGVRSCLVNMLTSHPFMIYLSLVKYSEDTLCLFPFTSCLSCMVERGCLVKAYDYFRETMPSEGYIRLMGPEKAMEEMSWVTLNTDDLEHMVPR